MSKMALCGVKAIAILNQTILTMNKATVILVDYPTPFKDPADREGGICCTLHAYCCHGIGVPYVTEWANVLVLR